MIKNILEKIIGNYSDRALKRIYPIVDEIEALEESIKALSDDQLCAKTDEFKARLANGETLDDIIPEAFAVVREASTRVLGMRHFRVQLIGGVVLHQGRISEMKTGEGKTLVATLPVYLNALLGKGVHVVTVNEYLARRDSEWMGKIYKFLGLTVGLIVHDMNNTARREAYHCDITYCTNNELGFDYLRDNMVTYKEEMVQRDLYYAIVDEVDSILIDEARTPLIISGMADKSTELYKKADSFAGRLKARVYKQYDDKTHDDEITEDYIVDEKANTAMLTTIGIHKAEQFFGVENLSDVENMTIMHHINQAIRAHGIMKLDKDYVIKDGEVIIVDEFTGRLMYGRRYSNGLHQAIEAKENVKIERESKTLATITFQNYFRMYEKLAGMTGTALTEEDEFQTIYKLDVVVIPTNVTVARSDNSDQVYKNQIGKYKAIISEILECNKKGQPVLVGTISIEKSELLSEMLRKCGVAHQVLNAKHHEREAEIIAQAGKHGTVTIATNMAGRGTDIVLGGNPEFLARQEMRRSGYSEELISAATSFAHTEDDLILEARACFRKLYDEYKKETGSDREKVIAAGGLYVIGTERHESRRIDNQLRGRSGRQGDPGSSRFYISLDDDLMRLFGSDRLTMVVEAMGLEEDQPIEHGMLTKAIENAQKRVEGKNFSMRKNVLQFDDVMNKQREIIYAQRKKVLNGENLKEAILKMMGDIAGSMVTAFCHEEHSEDWDIDGLKLYSEDTFVPKGFFESFKDEILGMDKEDLREKMHEAMVSSYEAKSDYIAGKFKELNGQDPDPAYVSGLIREFERVILLKVVDEKWMDHIDDMEQLMHGVSLRAYGQRDPVIEYKFEGFEMFEEMTRSIQEEVVKIALKAELDVDHVPQREKAAEPISATHGEEFEKKPLTSDSKVGRNDPCPCGSGKKYKKCCGV